MVRFSRAVSVPSNRNKLTRCAFAVLLLAAGVSARAADDVLRVCADPNNMPQSNKSGEGYENKIAEQLARDLNRKLEYTFFPQRMGFVRNTLRARDDTTQQFKCDVIIGVPSGYELTATTKPYMHSTYSMIFSDRGPVKDVQAPEDILKLPPEKLRALRIGAFARSPAADWLLRNNLLQQASFFAQQSGDPNESPGTVIDRALKENKIDLAIVWGPVAGMLANNHKGPDTWRTVAFKPDPQIKFDYQIAMGVRFGEKPWKDSLDGWITSHQGDIDKILASYKVPRVEGDAQQGQKRDDD
jgi:quinoprotein dehydrogenase-associated probable ABC transporter substrate-binding protein